MHSFKYIFVFATWMNAIMAQSIVTDDGVVTEEFHSKPMYTITLSINPTRIQASEVIFYDDHPNVILMNILACVQFLGDAQSTVQQRISSCIRNDVRITPTLKSDKTRTRSHEQT